VAPGGDLVRRAGGSRLHPQKGAIERLYTAPPEGGVVVCLDEMGPQASKSYPGRRLVRPAGPRAERAKQEIDYGRRGVAGYVFGALQPATGAAFAATYVRRTTANWVGFLGRVEGWVGPAAERVYAVVDNLNIHGGMDVLLFALAHPRWEFVFQPKYAAYLNLIEPWWKVLRSLALKGRRFEAWAEIEQAVEHATAYWNAHKHPFVWGRRRRHRMPRRLGIAAPPNVTLI
jgi:transposase